MFSLSELWSGSERRYRPLQPWWEVFMDHLVLLMFMVSVLAGTLLLSQDGLVCVPVHSLSSNNATHFVVPRPTGQNRCLLLNLLRPFPRVQVRASEPTWTTSSTSTSARCVTTRRCCGSPATCPTSPCCCHCCFWFHLPLTSARIEHFLAILAKCCESPWTSRALCHAARQDSTHGRPPEEGHATRLQALPSTAAIFRQPSLDSGTDSPLLVRTGSASAPPSPCPSGLSRCSTLSSLSLTSLPHTAPVVPEGSRPGPILDRSDGEQARALFERVRRFRAHCERSDIIYKVYAAQTVFRALMCAVIVGYITPLLGSISFSHSCRPLSYALTGYHAFQCTHSLASVLRRLMQAYICLVGLYGLVGIYTLIWIFHKSLRQYSFLRLREAGSVQDTPDVSNDLPFLLHMTEQYDPLLSRRLSVFLSPLSEAQLMEETPERRWDAARLCAMITSDHRGRSVLQLTAVPRLPPALFTLRQLDVLKLELIGDAKLPAQISNMTALRELHLHHCPARVEPAALLVLQERLESLHLTVSHVAEVPGWLYSLHGLRELRLSGGEGGMGRGWAPGSLRPLRVLRTLVLQRVPAELVEVAGSLERLEIRNEGVRLLGLAGLRRLEGLLDLELRGCRMERLPSALQALPGLRRLDLADNGLRTLDEPLGLWHLRRLSVLRLTQNRLTVLPASVAVLTGLELLDVSHNHLRILPPALFTLRRLRCLLLAGNLLEELPAEIGALVHLTELDLSGNALERLPGELFSQCVELRELNVAHNSLGRLPAGLGTLKRLSRLDVRGNNLEELPLELGCCPRLRGGGLVVEGRLLHTLPHHVRDVLQEPRSAPRPRSEANSRPDADCFPAFTATQWSFLSAVESRL